MTEMQVKQNNMSQCQSIVASDGKLKNYVKVKIQWCVLLVACLLFSTVNAELPPISELTTKERILVAELSRDVIPDANLAIAKLEALERSDLNDDGTIDLIDFAIFASDYGLFMPAKPVIKDYLTTEKTVVYQDETTKVIRYGEPNMPIYADFNDMEFVDWYLTQWKKGV
jgi:hypothetical protein